VLNFNKYTWVITIICIIEFNFTTTMLTPKRIKGRLKQLLIGLFIPILIVISCTKIDITSEKLTNDKEDVTNRFFNPPSNTNPLVQKVISECKVRNNRKEYVNEFSKTIGFPVWDKVIINIVKVNTTPSFASTSSNQDTLIYIPFVKQDSTTVNGFILATIHDSIYLRYCLAQDYKNYPFTTTSSITTASQFILQILRLNQIVFGVNDYLITDPRIFSSNIGLRKTKRLSFRNESNTNSNINLNSLEQICTTYWTETEIMFDPDGDADPCDCSGNEYYDYSIWEANTVCLPSIPIGGGGGGSGGGSSGGGGPLPYVYPCIPVAVGNFTNNSLTGDPLPPCPPPGGGSGWSPSNSTTNEDPCVIAKNNAKKMDTLYNNIKADSMLATIPNLATEPFEKGYAGFRKFTINPQNPLDTTFTSYKVSQMFNGTVNGLSLDYAIPNFHEVVAEAHTHPANVYAAQSAKDIYQLITSTQQNPYVQGNFAFASNGDKYAISITNPAQAAAFLATKSQFLNGNDFTENSTIGIALENAKKYFEKIYKGNANKINLAYEMALSAVLNQFNSGITLSKKDSTGHFAPIVVRTGTRLQNPKKIIYTIDYL
jgi:hypothetical protein